MKTVFITYLISLVALSQETGTTMTFVNGVQTSEDSYQINSIQLESIAKKAKDSLDPKGILYFDSLYNRTEGVSDLMEVAIQRAIELYPGILQKILYKMWSSYLRFGDISDDLSEGRDLSLLRASWNQVASEISSLSPLSQDTILLAQKIGGHLKSGNRSIVISHSQGNLFANSAYAVLKESEVNDKLGFYGNLMVASPTSISNAPNNDYITMTSDLIINALPDTFTANYSHDNSDYALIDPTGHGFIEIYSNPSINGASVTNPTAFKSMDQVLSELLINVAEQLEVPSRCEGEATLAHPNGGGLVSVNSIVDDRVFVGPNATICGNSKIGHLTKEPKARIAISGNAFIKDSRVEYNLQDFEITHDNTDFEINISGDAQVIQSAIIIRHREKYKDFINYISKINVTDRAILNGFNTQGKTFPGIILSCDSFVRRNTQNTPGTFDCRIDINENAELISNLGGASQIRVFAGNGLQSFYRPERVLAQSKILITDNALVEGRVNISSYSSLSEPMYFSSVDISGNSHIFGLTNLTTGNYFGRFGTSELIITDDARVCDISLQPSGVGNGGATDTLGILTITDGTYCN